MARHTQRVRRNYNWRGALVANASQSTSAEELVLATASEAETLVRVRGDLLVGFATAADGSIANVALALMHKPEGFTSIISSVVDLEKSFIWWGAYAIAFDAASPSADLVSARVHIDSKAMRKFKANDELVLLMDLTQDSGTPTATIFGGIRGLFMQ